ncbi:hypothetical protein PAMP_022910 [Pampus punctatissimus]
MDEYPEYDFYNSREECDGKEGREERREGGERKKRRRKGKWKRMRRQEARKGGGQGKTFKKREKRRKEATEAKERKAIKRGGFLMATRRRKKHAVRGADINILTHLKDSVEPELVLSTNRVGIMSHLVDYSDSDESQSPCTSSSQLNENWQSPMSESDPTLSKVEEDQEPSIAENPVTTESETTGSDVSTPQQDTVTPSQTDPNKSLKRLKGRQYSRRMWEKEEVAAVERHMMSFITSCHVPGKGDCDKCLNMEKTALKNRNWLVIKFYVKNRITALKKKI